MRKFITTILLIVIHSTFLIGQSSFVEMKEAAMIAQNFMNNKQQTSKTVIMETLKKQQLENEQKQVQIDKLQEAIQTLNAKLEKALLQSSKL